MKTMSQVACLSDCPETMEEARALIRSLNEQVRKMRGPHDGTCFSCGKPTNSLHGNPSLWAMHLPHVDGGGTSRTYHIGCLYPIVRAVPAGTSLNIDPP